MKPRILAINPGSTSTKLAIFLGTELIFEKTLIHDVSEIKHFNTIYDQLEFRLETVTNILKEKSVNLDNIDLFVGRGGLISPVESGTYLVNEKMISDLKEAKYGSHACNLGAIIACDLARSVNKEAYVVDPVVVDELHDVARVSGLKEIDRISVFHALNHKAVAKRYANEINKKYEELSLIVSHLGGGISVGWHKFGRIVDVNNALGGDGPFSPERCGDLPIFSLIDLCYSNKYSKDELKKHLIPKGGLVSYLNTSSGLEISRRINEGDKEAIFYFKAMAYQIAKEIGSLYFVAKGKIDVIILTGGLAYNNHLISFIKEYLPDFINLVIYPGEDEMSALAFGVLRVFEGKEEVKTY